MQLLEGVELGKQAIERAEELDGRRGVEIVYCRDREAEKEDICGFASELAGIVGRHATEVVLVEEVRVEPVDATLVAGNG